MIAIDTNILVRYYAQDDRDQAAVAERILREEPAVYVSLTVIVELYFVLQILYDFTAERVCRGLLHLAGLPNVTLDAYDRVQAALYMSRAGLEFPDALHLAASAHCSRLLTFDDRRFARRAARLGLKPPVSVP